MKRGEWTWLAIVNMTIQGLASAAAIVVAVLSWQNLGLVKVERTEVSMLHARATQQEEALSNTIARVDTLYAEAMDMALMLSNSLSRVDLYGDVLAAEGGDRFALERVQRTLCDKPVQKRWERDPLFEKLIFATRRFYGDIKGNPQLVSVLEDPFMETCNVPALLHHDWFLQRLHALKHIREFRANKYLPDVVEMLRLEPDLNVVQFAVAIINETFNDNIKPNDSRMFWLFSVNDCVFNFDEFYQHVMKMWEERKDEIIARKPKEVRYRANPTHPQLKTMYIHDPEISE